MIKRDLIDILNKKHGLPQSFSGRIVNTILDAIKSDLKKGNRVEFRNFGSFEVSKKWGKKRVQFNPSKNILK